LLQQEENSSGGVHLEVLASASSRSTFEELDTVDEKGVTPDNVQAICILRAIELDSTNEPAAGKKSRST